MLTKVQKWGNSQGLRFEKPLLRKAHLRIGDAVEISATKGRILIKRVARKKKFILEEMVARMPKEYQPREEDWGRPVGREAW